MLGNNQPSDPGLISVREPLSEAEAALVLGGGWGKGGQLTVAGPVTGKSHRGKRRFKLWKS